MRAIPEHPGNAAKHHGDRHARQDRTRADRRLRRAERTFDGIRIAAAGGRATVEGLHGADRADRLTGKGGCFGERILGRARALAHGAAEGNERKDDEGNGDQNQRREPRAGIDHHRSTPETKDQVPQRQRGRRPDHRLHLSRIRRQARNDLARLVDVEKGRGKLDDVGIDITPQVGNDPLANGDDIIIPHGAGKGEQQGQRDQHAEIVVDETGIRLRKNRGRSCAARQAAKPGWQRRRA